MRDSIVRFGIAIVPDHPILQSMGLKTLHITEPCPDRTTYLCRKRGVLHPFRAERFFNFCKTELNGKEIDGK